MIDVELFWGAGVHSTGVENGVTRSQQVLVASHDQPVENLRRGVQVSVVGDVPMTLAAKRFHRRWGHVCFLPCGQLKELAIALEVREQCSLRDEPEAVPAQSGEQFSAVLRR
jgi:hypothetical protein